MLLDNMRFFSVSHTLLAYGQGEALVLVMMRFIEAAAALGDSFFRWLTPEKPTVINQSKACPHIQADCPVYLCISVVCLLVSCCPSEFQKPYRTCFHARQIAGGSVIWKKLLFVCQGKV